MSSEFRIVVNLEDLVAWAPTSNVSCPSYRTWKSREDEKQRAEMKQKGHKEAKVSVPYWRGALIQFAKYRMLQWDEYDIAKKLEEAGKETESFFDRDRSITFFRGDDEVHSLPLGEIEQGIWINIFPVHRSFKKAQGDQLDSSTRKLQVLEEKTGVGILGRRRPISDENEIEDPKGPFQKDIEGLVPKGTDCQKYRLHPFMEPYPGGITFWYDVESGFDLAVRQDAHKKDRMLRVLPMEDWGSHNRSAFTLRDGPYDVDVYRWNKEKEIWKRYEKKKGDFSPDVFAEVDRIVLSSALEHAYGGDHGTHLDPPMEP